MRDGCMYPSLLVGVLTWPFWGLAGLLRSLRFEHRFAMARDIRSFDGEHLVGSEGEVVALEEVLRARAWTYSILSMASGAEELVGLELNLRDGRLRRYKGIRLDGIFKALVTAGKVAPEMEEGGDSGGIARPFFLLFWMVVLGGGLLCAAGRAG